MDARQHVNVNLCAQFWKVFRDIVLLKKVDLEIYNEVQNKQDIPFGSHLIVL